MKNNNLVTTIEIKDRQGRVVDTKEVVKYAGLLNRAHEEGLKKVLTELIQTPSKTNEMTAICMAEVSTDKGVFRDYGDANPENVSSMIVPHIIRMAVTRAKARALRDAVNIGVVAIEELDVEYLNDIVDNPAKPPTQNRKEAKETKTAKSENDNGKNRDSYTGSQARDSRNPERDSPPSGDSDGSVSMTDNQRRYLFRLLAERGINGEAAHDWLKQQLGVESLHDATKTDASDLINFILNNEVIKEGVAT